MSTNTTSALLSAWRAAFSDRGVTAAEVIKYVDTVPMARDADSDGAKARAARETLAYATKAGKLDASVWLLAPPAQGADRRRAPHRQARRGSRGCHVGGAGEVMIASDEDDVLNVEARWRSFTSSVKPSTGVARGQIHARSAGSSGSRGPASCAGSTRRRIPFPDEGRREYDGGVWSASRERKAVRCQFDATQKRSDGSSAPSSNARMERA